MAGWGAGKIDNQNLFSSVSFSKRIIRLKTIRLDGVLRLYNIIIQHNARIREDHLAYYTVMGKFDIFF